MTPLLAQLGAYDGMVSLALAKAGTIDPEQVAAQSSDAGRMAREVCQSSMPSCVVCTPAGHMRVASDWLVQAVICGECCRSQDWRQ